VTPSERDASSRGSSISGFTVSPRPSADGSREDSPRKGAASMPEVTAFRADWVRVAEVVGSTGDWGWHPRSAIY
jgi:hypothetical protein